MDRIADILRSSASWYAPIIDPRDIDQHDVGPDWAEKNFAMREFFAVVDAGQVIGCLSFQDTGSHLYLGYVYLHADHTGQGHGGRMLRFAADTARARGKEGMVLLAHPKADWAVRAYERFGFERVATTDARVLAWNDGWLEPYHERGFHLFEYRP